MTANAFKSDINIYIKAGFDDYLIKPFREAEFYNKMCNILGIEKPTTGDNMIEKEIKDLDFASKDKFNTNELWKTANGDRDFFEKMINNFIFNAESLVSVFAEGLTAENWKEIGERAHKAIPSFKYFALFNIANSLETIEDKTLRKPDNVNVAKITENTIVEIQDIINSAKLSLKERL
jgi:CheY-like chemotaxis protein